MRRSLTKSDARGEKTRRQPEPRAEELAEYLAQEVGLYRLTSPQEIALDGLLSGQTITAAAEAAGVARQTCSSWINHDVRFIAAYNKRRQLQADEIANRWRALTLKAFSALEQELDGKDRLEAAKTVLRAIAQLPPARGPVTPSDVEDEQERRADERLRALVLFHRTKLRLPSLAAGADDESD